MLPNISLATFIFSIGQLRCDERFGRTKTDRMYSLYGRIRYVEVCLTGPDSIRSMKTVRCTEGFITSRFVVPKFTCVILFSVAHVDVPTRRQPTIWCRPCWLMEREPGGEMMRLGIVGKVCNSKKHLSVQPCKLILANVSARSL